MSNSSSSSSSCSLPNSSSSSSSPASCSGPSGGSCLDRWRDGRIQQYLSRVASFQRRMNPLWLTLSDEQIIKAKKISQDAQNTDHKWARGVVDATVHPQTGEIISPLGRLAMFVPINIPICAGMLLAPATLPNLIGWQWVNQTYNAYFNFSQANKDSSKQQQGGVDIDLVKGYSCACLVSVGLAVGSSQWLSRSKSLSDVLRSRLRMIVPYVAVASAGVANVGLMRLRELTDGIPVFFNPAGDNQTPEPLGVSKVAAKQALMQTAISRIVLPIPILALPPPILALCYRLRAVKGSRILKVTAELTVLIAGLWVGLPCAVGIFPQMASLPMSDVEPELLEKAKEILRQRKGESWMKQNGNAVGDSMFVTFNKGV
eukprot:GHVS01105174.1.p1 GENE.GHVS01105174.1~~GHVS01105174.1.p1  ORF type:complete len:373 (-),score=48.43 GHVS01105174.1:390-1508(-)